MNYEDLYSIIAEIGLPFAYSHFAEGESPKPPFICFLYQNSENFGADNIVYHQIDTVDIELYADAKDPGKEAAVEAVLNSHEIFWEKNEVWIESEKLYEVVYSFSV